MKKLKLVALTSMLIFNLAVVFAATFAWFYATKNNLSGHDIGMQIDAQELHLDYTLYKFDETEKEVITLETFILNTYDSIIKEKNTNTPLVVKAVLMGNIFSDKTATDVSIDLTCTESSYYTSFLSNIVNFRFKSFTIEEENITNIYYTARTQLESETPIKFFTTTKLTSRQLILPNAPIIDGTITVYGLVDYDEDLIDQFISVNALTLDTMPVFQNDLNYIRFSVHE